MTKVYITGDRSMNPLLAVQVVHMTLVQVVADHGPDVELVTGASEGGIDRAVRYLVPNIMVAVPPLTDEGKPNFDELHKHLNETVDKVFVLHTDPMSSKIAASVLQNFAPDKVELPIQTALVGLNLGE